MIGHPREDLAAYAIGALEPPDRTAVDEHLRTCAPCRADAEAFGANAYALRVHTERLVVLPEGVSARLAAAVMLQGITAHYLAMDTYPIAPGERCLIHAGAES